MYKQPNLYCNLPKKPDLNLNKKTQTNIDIFYLHARHLMKM